VSRWNTARWATDRWPALSVADLLQQAPDPARGVPIGLGDWRLSVEILLPSDQLSTWGMAEWGEQEWNVLAWHDITEHVRGLSWTRGRDEPYGRPRVGELTVTLESLADEFSPFNKTPPLGTPAYFGPGTIVRVGARSATDTRADGWLPQFCGVVDAWSYTYGDPTAVERFVDVSVVETLRDLAQIDANALPAAVGLNEAPIPRFQRLLAAAGWPYGLLVEAQNIIGFPASYPMQATAMTLNRLAECYLTADSCDVTFRTDRTGAALLTSPSYISSGADPKLLPLIEFSFANANTPAIYFAWYPSTASGGNIAVVPYLADSFKAAPDDSNVVNDARFARVGGTQQVWERRASISRYGRRTLVRSDFIVNSDAVVLQQAQYVTARQALNVLRVNALTVDVAQLDAWRGLSCLAADIGALAWALPPSAVPGDPVAPFVRGRIADITHNITPRNRSALTWEITFGLDTETVVNIPGAQLPPT
jgi:hypothetical protein